MVEPSGFCAWGEPMGGGVMAEKRQIQFERYTNLPLGDSWSGEWPAYVLVHHEGAVDDVKYVPERTCHDEAESPQSFLCGECGWFWTDPEDELGFRYCPNCGARVVEEEK